MSEVSLGGQWEVVHFDHNSAITNGYAARFKADGSHYRLLRFQLLFAGMNTWISQGANTRCFGAINRSKHDGSGSTLNQNGTNTGAFEVLSVGTGGVQGYLMPRRQAAPGWLMCVAGYSGLIYLGQDHWQDASGDYWSWDGRLMFQKVGTPANDWDFDFGFGSNTGTSGGFSLLVEGLRG